VKTLNNFKDSRGFTLVELLVAVCVMAIAFAGLATMQIACINGNSIASNITTGMTLAQDKMEELNSLDYNDPELADNNVTNDPNLQDAIDDSSLVGNNANSDDGHRETGIDAEGNAGGMYNRIWNISDNTPTTGMKTTVVIVTWAGHKVTVSSIK
jgi:prepilin-type N-terminal cleavage/methylation domain-containing protein